MWLKIINYLSKYFVISKQINKFSYCESSSAQSNSKWHIRKIDERGRKLGGGIYSKSLCKYVQPTNNNGWGGWDLQTKITDQNLKVACKKMRRNF